MHICIDCRFQTCSGIGRYIREKVSNLVKKDSNVNIYTLIVDNSNLDNEFKIDMSTYANVAFINCNAKMYSVLEQFQLPFIIPKCDVFWAPHYNAPFFPIRAKKK